MSWLDTLLDRGNEAKTAHAPNLSNPKAQHVAPSRPRQPKPELMMVWVQTRAPFSNDPGGCEAGYYSVADGVLTMHEENGKPTGKTYRLGPTDNERVVASRLTLEKWRSLTPDFNRPLYYPNRGFA